MYYVFFFSSKRMYLYYFSIGFFIQRIKIFTIIKKYKNLRLNSTLYFIIYRFSKGFVQKYPIFITTSYLQLTLFQVRFIFKLSLRLHIIYILRITITKNSLEIRSNNSIIVMFLMDVRKERNLNNRLPD